MFFPLALIGVYKSMMGCKWSSCIISVFFEIPVSTCSYSHESNLTDCYASLAKHRTDLIDLDNNLIVLYCIVLYCIDGVVIAALMHCDFFEIYCAPSNF